MQVRVFLGAPFKKGTFFSGGTLFILSTKESRWIDGIERVPEHVSTSARVGYKLLHTAGLFDFAFSGLG